MDKPDTTEKGIRFGCGFLFGLFLGAILAVSATYGNGESAIAIVIATAFVVAVASMKFGDSFWRWLSRSNWWWP